MDHAFFLFRNYMGIGLTMIWFLLSVIYLFLKEKKKQIRIVFVYVPVVLLLLFFNPMFAGVMEDFLGDEIYYRVLWLIPVVPVIGYTILQICVSLKGKARLGFTVGAAVLIVLSGSYIYGNRFFKKAENLYHIPESVVEICDAVRIPGREVMAVFPLDMVQYVRQYAPSVCMPYGREMLVETAWNGWAAHEDLCDVMEGEKIDASELCALAREASCHYIVLSQEKVLSGSMAEGDFAEFAKIKGYTVYIDKNFERENMQ